MLTNQLRSSACARIHVVVMHVHGLISKKSYSCVIIYSLVCIQFVGKLPAFEASPNNVKVIWVHAIARDVIPNSGLTVQLIHNA